MKKYNVAVVGATGLVGRTILSIMEERGYPVETLRCLSSKRSAGQIVQFAGKDIVVEELTESSFDAGVDIAFFAAGGAVSEKFAPIAVEKGVVVIDNSSVFRMNPDVPLVVPEVNGEDIFKNKGIVSNPNCSTIQCMPPLKALQEKYGIKRVIYSTYQSVSGSGLNGLKDLDEGLVEFYPYPIQYNVLPHIDVFLENGYTKEEMKMIEETRKILGDPDMKITATTVRVPVRFAHSVSVNVELEKSFDISEVKEVLSAFPGIIVKDDPKNDMYPMPIDVEGKDEIFVGRIRRDFSLENGLNIWIVADNIRKGAATNAVQIGEIVAKGRIG
ncbi:MAG: aspartate-semialdehyde dehydrogenase [Gudongella sp.]|nr:aspartate-semialdehyde dehydrogenase [Gudongella sp.]